MKTRYTFEMWYELDIWFFGDKQALSESLHDKVYSFSAYRGSDMPDSILHLLYVTSPLTACIMPCQIKNCVTFISFFQNETCVNESCLYERRIDVMITE